MGAQNPSPILFGANYAQNLQTGELQADGSIIRYNGAKNYVIGNFENLTLNGWSLFNTTLTNGIPTGTINSGASSISNIAVTTGAQIGGVASLIINANSTLLAGQGFISPVTVTIDPEDQAKVLTFKFYYSCTQGASSANFSGTSSNSLAVYFYDTANAQWVQPAGVYGMTQSSGVGYCTGTFQTASNATTYQMAILCVNSVSATFSLITDDFFLGPQTAPIGAPVTSWQSYTPTISGSSSAPTLGTNVTSAYWRRLGDSMEIIYSLSQSSSGSGGSGLWLFSLPSGYSINSSVLNVTTGVIGAGANVLGTGQASTTTATSTNFAVMTSVWAYNTTNLAMDYTGSANGQMASVSFSNLAATNNPLYITFRAVVPITGWSANVQMSSDTDTRVIAFSALNQTPTGTLTNARNIVKFGTVTSDSAGAYNTSTGIYTVPVSGYYSVSSQVEITGTISAVNQTAFITLEKNSVITANGGVATPTSSGTSIVFNPQLSSVVYCNAGDTLGIYSFTTLGSPSYTSTFYASNLSINRLSGPAVIAATESVNMSYNTSSSTISSTLSTVTYSNKIRDSHNEYAAGVYTIPISGTYQVQAGIAVSGTFTLNSTVDLQIQQAGSATQIAESKPYAGGAVTALAASAGDLFYCLDGDTLKVQVSCSATSPSIVSSASQNYFSITRVGN